MPTKMLLCTLLLLPFLASQAAAQPPALIIPPLEPNESVVNDQPKEKEKKAPEKKAPESPTAAPLQFPPTNVNEFQSFFTPNMMGDKQGTYARRTVVIVGTQTTVVTSLGDKGNAGKPPVPPGAPMTTTTTVAQARTVVVAVPSRGAFNIAENESPMPRDRVFTCWNNYSNLGFPQTGLNAPIVTTTSTNMPPVNRGGIPVNIMVTTVFPGVARVDLNRETFGFEKTFLDGNASIEVRAPLVQQQSGGIAGLGVNDVGDLTIVGKYALLLDRSTGNVFSVGLVVTAPTGRGIDTTDGTLRDTLIQPFIGYIWNYDRFFVQGFHSIVIPTDARDVTLAFNDIGIGYWLYRGSPNRFLSSVVPCVEAHVGTPLNHRDMNGPIIMPDEVVMTTCVHLGLFRNASLTVGAGVPVTGPRPYTVETIVQFNWRF